MNSQEYTRLKDSATRRAHVLRQEALYALWDAVVRRFTHFTHLAHKEA